MLKPARVSRKERPVTRPCFSSAVRTFPYSAPATTATAIRKNT